MCHGITFADTLFSMLLGVLHEDASWGAGTTEYALEAIKCAVEGTEFKCPVPLDESLPMIFAPDLIDGLIALMEAAPPLVSGEEEGAAPASELGKTPVERAVPKKPVLAAWFLSGREARRAGLPAWFISGCGQGT